MRPIRARIDTAALLHNHGVARRLANSARMWSVIKADAYGHGLMTVALALADHADGFALVELEGAAALREAGIRQPLLLMEGFYQADELPLFAELELTPVLHAPWQVDALVNAGLPVRMPVFLKVNTGMNRLGFEVDEFNGVLARLVAADCVSAVTVMTHFADADEERGIGEQRTAFEAMLAGRRLPVSMANSASLLRFPESVGDWVRPGIMLYGSSPFPAVQAAADLGLRPVMTLEAEIIAVRNLKPGDRIGYGGSFVADQPLRIGVVACGYADGYPRHAPTGTPVVVEGWRTRTLGRVSMDKLCVDLTPLPAKVGAGATATLWGGQDATLNPADEVAMAAGTVAYELFCALASRVPLEEIG